MPKVKTFLDDKTDVEMDLITVYSNGLCKLAHEGKYYVRSSDRVTPLDKSSAASLRIVKKAE